MTSLIHTIIKIKIKKLKFIIKTLDNYKKYNSYNSDNDTDIDDSDFASNLLDTKIKTQLNIIEIDEDLSEKQSFQTFSSLVSKKIYLNKFKNPEFIHYRNYNIHIRFSKINNKNYIILIIDNKNNNELRNKSNNIILNFSNFNHFIFNKILFDIDFDIYSKNININNLIKNGRITNKISYNQNYSYNQKNYSYVDGIFNYFIQINTSNNTLNYYYYRIDKYIFNPIVN